MQIQMTGQGMDVTQALRDLTIKKLRRIQSHIEHIISIRITFHVNKVRQIADAKVGLPGNTINANAESNDMYKTIDLLIKKLQSQLARYKEKMTEHH